jgi:hypothetical protein
VHEPHVLKSAISRLVALGSAAVHVVVVANTRKAGLLVLAASQLWILARRPEVRKQLVNTRSRNRNLRAPRLIQVRNDVGDNGLPGMRKRLHVCTEHTGFVGIAFVEYSTGKDYLALFGLQQAEDRTIGWNERRSSWVAFSNRSITRVIEIRDLQAPFLVGIPPKKTLCKAMILPLA